MTGARMAVLLIAAVAVVAGNWLFHYQSDDAYIAYRYARNAADGLGFVYNAPFFRPVEGYTSFAWVAMLAGIDALTGLGADQIAPALSLLSALLTLVVLHHLVPHTRALALVLLATVSNRTWLAWTTSGLETPLWTLCLLLWVLFALRQRFAWLFLLSALLPLVRPDGYLYAALTPGLFLLVRRAPTRAEGLGLLVYAVPLLHLLWRFQTYGFWLPNTYYAKVVRPWPSMGAIYLGSFIYEYALLPVLFVVAYAAWKKGVPALVAGVVLILTAHLLTHLRWGGDHFEYRILVHWIPLIWIAAVQALPLSRVVFRGLFAVWMLGLFLPWVHFVRHDSIRFDPIADAPVPSLSDELPGVFWPWVYPWERAQRKMHHHLVGIRHHHLRRFIEGQRIWYADLPELGPGLHVLTIRNPGWPGWVLPEVGIVDLLGLTDAVVAHGATPPKKRNRRFAHERSPPEGYVRCLSPDLELVHERGGQPPVQLVVTWDGPTVSRVRHCERKFWKQIGI